MFVRSLIILLIFCVMSLHAQSDQHSMAALEAKMVTWGQTIIKDSLLENRQRASIDMETALMSALQEKGSFSYPFDSVKTVSIQYPSDSTFRIFTWQLYVDLNQYDYYGMIQTNEDKPKLIPLKDKSSNMTDLDLEYEVLSPDNWFGAVYYKIKSFDTPKGKKHLLFGYDGHQFFNKKKLIDVLTLENGQASFGEAIFAPADISRTDLFKNRIMLQYSAETSVTLNYNKELEMILFDYLIPYKGPYGPTYVPDGSYQGYRLQNGLWVYVEKVFDQVSEQAPMPAPILNKRTKKDIFGKRQ